MKRLIRIFLVISVMSFILATCSTFVGFAQDSKWSSEGYTENDLKFEDSVGKIYSSVGLAKVSEMVNSGEVPSDVYCFQLQNNIDLSGKIFEPIGKDLTKNFSLKFDFNGYSVQGLKITGEFAYAGLFGVNEGIIINPSVEVDVIDVYTNSGNCYAGGVVGMNRGVIGGVDQKDVSANVIINNLLKAHAIGSGDSYAGGFVAINSKDANNVGLLGTSGSGSVSFDAKIIGQIISESSKGNAVAGGIVGLSSSLIGTESADSGNLVYSAYIEKNGVIKAIGNNKYARSGGLAGEIGGKTHFGIMNKDNASDIHFIVNNNAENGYGIIASAGPSASNSKVGGIIGVNNIGSFTGTIGSGKVVFLTKSYSTSINVNIPNAKGYISGNLQGRFGAINDDADNTIDTSRTLAYIYTDDNSVGLEGFSNAVLGEITIQRGGTVEFSDIDFEKKEAKLFILPESDFKFLKYTKNGKDDSSLELLEDADTEYFIFPLSNESFEFIFDLDIDADTPSLRMEKIIEKYVESASELNNISDFEKADLLKNEIDYNVIDHLSEDQIQILKDQVAESNELMKDFAEATFEDAFINFKNNMQNINKSSCDTIYDAFSERDSLFCSAADYSNTLKDYLECADSAVCSAILDLIYSNEDGNSKIKDFKEFENFFNKFVLSGNKYYLSEDTSLMLNEAVDYYQNNFGGFNFAMVSEASQTELGVEFTAEGKNPIRLNYNEPVNIEKFETVFYINGLAYYSNATRSNAIAITVLNTPNAYKNEKYTVNGETKVADGFSIWMSISETETMVRVYRPDIPSEINQDTKIDEFIIGTMKTNTTGNFMRYNVSIEKTKLCWIITVNKTSFTLGFDLMPEDVFVDGNAYFAVGSFLSDKTQKNTMTIYQIGDKVFGDETNYNISTDIPLPPLISAPDIILDGLGKSGCGSVILMNDLSYVFVVVLGLYVFVRIKKRAIKERRACVQKDNKS